MIRLFVGIGLDRELTERLEALAAGLPGARWIDPENFHVTLRFIGEVEEGLAREIDEILASLAMPGFALTLEGLGTFGKRQPHTLWAGVARDPALVRLHTKIEAALVHQGGLEPEARKFQPHVTLARLTDTPVPRLQSFIAGNSPFRAGPQRVAHFTLYRSLLGRDGARYEPLADYPLTPA
jgi:2'-5' RNA ligase